MAQPDGQQSEPQTSARQKLLRKLFGPKQNEKAPETLDDLPEVQIQHFDDIESDDDKKSGLMRRISKSVVPGLPRTQTFKRQQSERRACLAPIEPSTDERRAVSMDRRNASLIRTLHHTNPDPRSSAPAFMQISPDVSNFAPSLPVSPSEEECVHHRLDEILENGGDVVDNRPDDTRSMTTSVYDSQIKHELETIWILNLSMHFKDRSKREKFFVTYRETDHTWRRVTISIDYRDAPPNSLQSDLLRTKYQKDKSAKIYEAIRESLGDIQFYDTVTNLKLETTDGRLHVHVVEDGNEIIHYPPVSQVTHLGCRRIREEDIAFDSHMSGFVYKVRVGGEVLIKKEIPSPETIEEFLYEINALDSLKYSDHVIKFYGVVVDKYDEHVKGILISYADGGALIDVIYDHCKDSGHGLEWPLRERWAKQIVNGLADVHESGFVQGDFTLSNIVIDQSDNAKIIDINRRGCPVGWEPPEATALIESNHRISMYIGVKSDLYQLGMVLWALAMEEDEPEAEGRPLLLGPEVRVPDWYRQVTEICLNPDARKRKSASLLLEMFPKSGQYVPPVPEVDRLSLHSYPWDSSYVDELLRSRFPKTYSEGSEYSNPYQVTGPPAHELWNSRPRGRSPPSPQPSNEEFNHNAAWAANKEIRASYSDMGADEMQPNEVVQQLTPSPSAERIGLDAVQDENKPVVADPVTAEEPGLNGNLKAECSSAPEFVDNQIETKPADLPHLDKVSVAQEDGPNVVNTQPQSEVVDIDASATDDSHLKSIYTDEGKDAQQETSYTLKHDTVEEKDFAANEAEKTPIIEGLSQQPEVARTVSSDHIAERVYVEESQVLAPDHVQISEFTAPEDVEAKDENPVNVQNTLTDDNNSWVDCPMEALVAKEKDTTTNLHERSTGDRDVRIETREQPLLKEERTTTVIEDAQTNHASHPSKRLKQIVAKEDTTMNFQDTIKDESQLPAIIPSEDTVMKEEVPAHEISTEIQASLRNDRQTKQPETVETVSEVSAQLNVAPTNEEASIGHNEVPEQEHSASQMRGSTEPDAHNTTDTAELPVLSDSIASEPDIQSPPLQNNLDSVNGFTAYESTPRTANMKLPDSLAGVGAGHMTIDDALMRDGDIIYEDDFHVVAREAVSA